MEIGNTIRIGSSDFKVDSLVEPMGNHALIWRALECSTGMPSVIKHPNIMNIPENMRKDRCARARWEARIYQTISKDKNIPPTTSYIAHFHDWGEVEIYRNRVPVIALKYYQNSLTKEVLKNDYSGMMACKWILQICKMLTVCSQSFPGIILRDLKPDNLMINDQMEIRSIDFGVSSGPSFSEGTSNMFSDKWTSPEQIYPFDLTCDGHWVFKITPKVDVFSLGLIAFTLFSKGGKTDFQSMGAKEYMILRTRYWSNAKERNWQKALNSFVELSEKDIEKLRRSYGMLREVSDFVTFDDLSRFISRMLSGEPQSRPSLEEVIEFFTASP